MDKISFSAIIVCVCFLNVFQISKADPSGCEKPPRPSCDSTPCTKGVCLGPAGNRKCYPWKKTGKRSSLRRSKCRDDSQCFLVSNDKVMCLCADGLTGDHCECSSSAACPAGWLLEGRSCYLFAHTMSLAWDDAKDYCENIGLPRVSSLVNVDDEDKYNYIRDYLIANAMGGFYWIGGRYNYTTSDHRWLDGTAVSLDANLWGPGRPGNIKGCMDYLVQFDWKWNTHPDCVDTPGPFICEIKIDQ